MVEESWRAGAIHVPFNTTFISLISKTNDPHTYYDFKPISLCNCMYKILENVIDQRLKVVLKKNKSKEQFGFMEGHQIHEAISGP